MKSDDQSVNERLAAVLVHFPVALTARQLARTHRLSLATASRRLRTLAKLGLARCANPFAPKSRVYTLTPSGRAVRQQLREEAGLPPIALEREANLALFGEVCYRHRTAVLRALDEPLQPAAIKRRALRDDPTIRISANNVRDIIYWFTSVGLVLGW